MSAGPGKLQKAILDNLNANRQNLPILLNRLLWEIAFDRAGIQKTGRQFRSSKAIIEEGTIKKSFDINLRRAINSLIKSKRVVRTKNKMTDIDSTLMHLPYITPKLEIYHLRKELLSSIKKYIDKEERLSAIMDLNPFAYQVEILKKNKDPEYITLQKKWKKIEEMIVPLLKNTEFKRFDLWLDVMVWGRYHFRERKDKMLRFPKLSRQTLNEELVTTKIETLIERIKTHSEFKIGETKKVLYELFNAPSHGETSLTGTFKHYLIQDNEELMRSLLSYQVSTLVEKNGFADLYMDQPRYRRISVILDQLFNRHIFRKLSFLDLPN